MKDQLVLLRACIAFLLAVLLLTATARSSQNDSGTATEKVRITSGPTVEHAGAEDAVVAWSTNVSSGTQVLYGTDRAHLDQVAETPWGALTHRVTLKKLAPSTTYYYEVVSDQALGTGGKIESGVEQFTTKEKTQAAGR
jgi:phosphodiesterase/alkaline phosphatase D-like protein